MTFFERTKGAAASAASTARRQARRAQLELEHRRLEGRINKTYAEIGRALLPLIEDGKIEVELVEVENAMVTLRGLLASVRANREELQNLGGPMPVGEAAFHDSEE